MVDIKLLFEAPEKVISGKLHIRPLAPLSLVTSMPGAYYRSQSAPSNYMIYGMLENLFGWHFHSDIRSNLLKKIKKELKKKYKYDSIAGTSAVGFQTLLQDHLEVLNPIVSPPILVRYDDYWTQSMKRTDEQVVHANGTPNLDWKLIDRKYRLPKDEKRKIKEGDYKAFFKKNIKQFPTYYTTIVNREYIELGEDPFTKGCYQVAINTTESVWQAIEQISHTPLAPSYLGNSEGWVQLEEITI
ncbi:type I-PGING CRISPR-associated protein Cas5p [Flammeovirga aprica]|uniref:Type I-PGING CRISPR-associated protein Cas5p n=1 Tax=Flammeovirga aprica JL-4 TaxID=694437 RepID=A0A7X9P0L3_9BACT|nr:type I-PGING CRISPR-associated protein Cas5p [Flammeovirga aprica]NME67359.1 type I-PGING CRISPR-associated protein Cas5p [Flammeovirga aprica JL-4]